MSERGEGVHTEATRDPATPLVEGSLAAARLVALYGITRELLAERAPQPIARRILDALVRHLEAERGALLARGPDGSLRPVASHGVDLDGPEETWPLSRSVVRHVIESGLAVLASDIRGDPQFKGSESVHRFRIRSVLAVPLGPRPARGVIYLDTRGEHHVFDPGDLEFATALSLHAALVLDRAFDRVRAEEALAASDERLAVLQEELLRHEIVGRSPAIVAAYDAVRRFARAGARVVLRGETGTGKELFARAYAAESARRGGPWVPVPIPALAPGLVESELFGHVRGAFTEATRDKKGRLEVADGGVLFLDEIGDVEPALQTKLLRFLDSGELYRVGDTQARRVDALVVSATNRPLEKDVETGRLRADLLARLGHVVKVPPLREREGDVPLLVEHFLRRHDRGVPPKRLAPEALAALVRYSWPLNVRELQQVVERVVCLVDREVIGASDLPEEVRSGPAGPPGAWTLRPLRAVVDDVERRHILRTLEHTGGNRRKAIELLGISPETFYRRLEEYGLHRRSDESD